MAAKKHQYLLLRDGSIAALLLFGFRFLLDGESPNSSTPPYPQSQVIKKITFDWDTYATAAPGSDLWPVTWGLDGFLYIAWGDGGGFGGTDSDGRVSLGVARIEGEPTKYRAININGGKNPEHPASFPNSGKTAGLAFVDEILYSMVNLQDGKWPDVNHLLVWSTNRGATWQKADWVFPKGNGNFQPAKFLNFGRGYTGLPGWLAGYVYLLGPKEEPAPKSIYLARVPREQVRERTSYEFFRGPESDNKAKWTSDFGQAQPVFSDTNGVTPASIIYDPAINRFLLTSYHTGPGQLGVFDAAHPWGPWTKVAYYENWGGMGTAGEGLSCEFPQKWMSADGLTVWAIFSVYGEGGKKGIGAHDKFNLIRVKLTLVD